LKKKLTKANDENNNLELKAEQQLALTANVVKREGEYEARIVEYEARIANNDVQYKVLQQDIANHLLTLASSNAECNTERSAKEDLQGENKKLLDKILNYENEIKLYKDKADKDKVDNKDDANLDKINDLLKQLQQVSSELRKTTAESITKESLVTELKERSQSLTTKLQSERKRHKSYIEQALNSIVRLCIVAPTVNVNMTPPKSTNELSYKAPLPKEKIKAFVQDEVLPKFATIFRQDQDGYSPYGGDLDSWLKQLLTDMQYTIEKHLANVFSTS
jgi:hypothetical protein